MSRPTGVPVRWRLSVLAAGAIALLAGLYAGLLLLGAPTPAPPTPVEQVHGPLMVLGFVGTLLAEAGGAFAWYAAVLLWLAGFSIAETVPWLAVFVVATIAGERLDLAHVGLPHRHPEGWFLTALAALLAGATAATVWPATGAHLFGAGLLAVVAWLAVFDVARRTVRATALPRYVAVGLLAGYAWLALAGLLWAGAGATVDGPRYDTTLHAVFLGFVMSMIFVPVPVILPAVLRRPLPYHRLLYAPLAVLHASLLVRVGLGDALGVEPVWRWAGVVNVAAVLGFAACAVTLSVAHLKPAGRPTVSPARRSTNRPSAVGVPS